MTVRAHPTALVEDGVVIGERTSIWDNAHLRAGARVGADCIVGGKTYIGPGVVIGNKVKINAAVYLCTGVTVEDGAMISAGTIFTNDRYPRATSPDLGELRPSGAGDGTPTTRVCQGATIGAGSVIGCDLVIGRWSMVGMGSVVTRSVPDFHLVMGQPARAAGWVCRCGAPMARFGGGAAPVTAEVACPACARAYRVDRGEVSEQA
ncbi:MAG: DapH/DapD/GlmU-related protein [Acidimicrobiales bacterium]